MRPGFRIVTFALLAVSAAAGWQVSFDPARMQQPQAPASSTPPEQRCVLAGRVTNAQTGEPVKKADVRLMRRFNGQPQMVNGRMPANQGYSGSSDADGNFHIENIEPGDYYLSGSRNGFLNTQYGAKKPMQGGTLLTLRPSQQMTDVTLGLTPQAVITGKVVDEDGDPVANAGIQVLAQQWFRGKLRYMPRNGSNTNDLGEYRIANLGPGKYFLSVQKMGGGFAGPNEAAVTPGKPDIRPVRTYFPGSTTLDSATAIDVKPGQDLSGMDIRLHSAQTYHVRGRIVGALPDGDRQEANLNLSERGESFGMFFNNQARVAKDRTFDIAGVAPGAYNLNAFILNGPARSVSTTPVDVGAGDVNDVLVTIVPPANVTGQIRLEGTAPAGSSAVNLQSCHVILSPADPMQMFFGSGNGQVAADGTFTLQNVSPGKYFVNVNAPAGTYTKEILYGQTDVNGKELDFSEGASGELQVVMRYGTAEVDFTVQSPSGATQAASSNVYLIPDPPRADGGGMRVGGTSSGNSTFALKNLPPGRYRAYAFEEANYDSLQNPDFLKELASRGVDVELKENDKKQVQLPIISSDEMGQILAKLGLDAQQ